MESPRLGRSGDGGSLGLWLQAVERLVKGRALLALDTHNLGQAAQFEEAIVKAHQE